MRMSFGIGPFRLYGGASARARARQRRWQRASQVPLAYRSPWVVAGQMALGLLSAAYLGVAFGGAVAPALGAIVGVSIALFTLSMPYRRVRARRRIAAARAADEQEKGELAGPWA